MQEEGTYNNPSPINAKKTRCRNPLKVIEEALADGTLESWARAGATDRQLAHYLGIGKDSFIRAKKEVPELTERISRARRPLVPEAFHSLVRLANGYEYTESVEEIREVLCRGEIIRLKTWTTYHKHMAPNLNAISRVIVNYQNQEKNNLDGVPSEYLITPPETETEQKQGRLPALDEAMKELFFGSENKGRA